MTMTKLCDRWERVPSSDVIGHEGELVCATFRWSDMEPQGMDWFVGDEVVVKWDGCIHFYSRDACEEQPDYIHICELDDHIARLTKLRDAAIKAYDGLWPRG